MRFKVKPPRNNSIGGGGSVADQLGSWGTFLLLAFVMWLWALPPTVLITLMAYKDVGLIVACAGGLACLACAFVPFLAFVDD